ADAERATVVVVIDEPCGHVLPSSVRCFAGEGVVKVNADQFDGNLALRLLVHLDVGRPEDREELGCFRRLQKTGTKISDEDVGGSVREVQLAPVNALIDHAPCLGIARKADEEYPVVAARLVQAVPDLHWRYWRVHRTERERESARG